MGILSNTVNICQFQVLGDLPKEDFFTWAAGCLNGRGFSPIDNSSEEISVGWVLLDDRGESRFDLARSMAFQRDHYLVFSLRRDQRKLPAALVRSHMDRAQEEFLTAHPGLRRVPRQKKEELTDAVRSALLSRTLPVPSFYDVVWDTRNHRITFTSLSPKVIDIFEQAFRETFQGVRLVAVHPFSRARSVAGEPLLPSLENANQAGSDAVVDQIRGNRWIGRELLLWLLYRGMNGSGEYRVSQPGPAASEETFSTYLDDRLKLISGGEEGVQKITVAGPQDHFDEVRSALKNAKDLVEGTLHLERGNENWKLTLKGETFQFASFRCPGVKLEKDDITDPEREKEAIFFEKMGLMEEGIQLFDSVYSLFLENRLGPEWPSIRAAVDAWLRGD